MTDRDDTAQHGNAPWPVVFAGHGTPLNAMMDNRYARAWGELGRRLGRPRAILSVSAHWYTRGTGVTAMPQPPTLYDFGYTNMFHLKYPAPGSPALAARVAELLAPAETVADGGWGFDHGTWAVLIKMYPQADVPVVQLSIDATLGADAHYARGRLLAPLRREGVLIFASGNVVHNLARRVRADGVPPAPWAQRFDGIVGELLARRDWAALADYRALDPEAELAVPTPDHYLPLLYAAGAADPGEPLSFPVDGIEGATMSMRSVLFGQA